MRPSGGCGTVPSGARKLAAPSFNRVETASKRTRRSLPRGELEVELPDSRTVIVPSGLIETLLSLGWNSHSARRRRARGRRSRSPARRWR